jgi:prepilin-type N-terminal cleavage/methylation domain-containing protein/prepilin-type processing-associated H-X9-DG protein
MTPGFTLVELLVVIAIIGILVALLLPAIQAAREAARRAQCQNNLRNIADAALIYESTYKYLPPGRFGCDGTAGDANCVPFANSRAASGFITMLPFLEEQPLYDSVDFTNGPWKTPSDVPERDTPETPHLLNQPLIEAQLAVMSCPTDTKAPFVEFRTIREATGSYAFCSGARGPSCKTTHASKYRKPKVGKGQNGVFMYLQGTETHGIPIRQIEDGVSKTYFFGETADGHLSPTRNRWTAAGRYLDGLRTTENPMNTPIGVGGNEWDPGGVNSTGCFASKHPGGAQFAFGDGRVEFVSEDIAGDVYQAAGTRSGGDDASANGSASPQPGCLP